MQFSILLKKELLESWRNRKWIWLPIVLILLTLTDPLSMYFLPEILELSGGLPKDAILEIPEITSSEALLLSMNQLSMLGALLIVFVTMNLITNERKTGVIEMIFAKPISTTNFVLAKWLANILIMVMSLLLAFLLHWYYVNILFDEFPLHLTLQAMLFYSLWFILIITLALFYNAIFKSASAVVGANLATLIFMYIINLIFGHKLTLFPNQLSTHIASMIETNKINSQLLATSSIIVALIISLLLLTVVIFQRKEIL